MGKDAEGPASRFSGLLLIPPRDNNVIPKMDRRLRMAEVTLRFTVVIFALVSAIIVGTASATRDIFGLQKHVRFTLLKTLLFLVIVDGIVALYSLLQGLRCFSSLYMQSILLSKPLAWAIFFCDQTMAYVTFAAAASSTEAAYISEQGQEEFGWLNTCIFFRAYCFKCGAGLINAFLAAICFGLLSQEMYMYGLFSASMKLSDDYTVMALEILGKWASRYATTKESLRNVEGFSFPCTCEAIRDYALRKHKGDKRRLTI